MDVWPAGERAWRREVARTAFHRRFLGSVRRGRRRPGQASAVTAGCGLRWGALRPMQTTDLAAAAPARRRAPPRCHAQPDALPAVLERPSSPSAPSAPSPSPTTVGVEDAVSRNVVWRAASRLIPSASSPRCSVEGDAPVVDTDLTAELTAQ